MSFMMMMRMLLLFVCVSVSICLPTTSTNGVDVKNTVNIDTNTNIANGPVVVGDIVDQQHEPASASVSVNNALVVPPIANGETIEMVKPIPNGVNNAEEVEKIATTTTSTWDLFPEDPTEIDRLIPETPSASLIEPPQIILSSTESTTVCNSFVTRAPAAVEDVPTGYTGGVNDVIDPAGSQAQNEWFKKNKPFLDRISCLAKDSAHRDLLYDQMMEFVEGNSYTSGAVHYPFHAFVNSLLGVWYPLRSNSVSSRTEKHKKIATWILSVVRQESKSMDFYNQDNTVAKVEKRRKDIPLKTDWSTEVPGWKWWTSNLLLLNTYNIIRAHSIGSAASVSNSKSGFNPVIIRLVKMQLETGPNPSDPGFALRVVDGVTYPRYDIHRGKKSASYTATSIYWLGKILGALKIAPFSVDLTNYNGNMFCEMLRGFEYDRAQKFKFYESETQTLSGWKEDSSGNWYRDPVYYKPQATVSTKFKLSDYGC